MAGVITKPEKLTEKGENFENMSYENMLFPGFLSPFFKFFTEFFVIFCYYNGSNLYNRLRKP